MPRRRDWISDFQTNVYALHKFPTGDRLPLIQIRLLFRVLDMGPVRYQRNLYRIYQADTLRDYLQELSAAGHRWLFEDGSPHSQDIRRDPNTVAAEPYFKAWEPIGRY